MDEIELYVTTWVILQSRVESRSHTSLAWLSQSEACALGFTLGALPGGAGGGRREGKASPEGLWAGSWEAAAASGEAGSTRWGASLWWDWAGSPRDAGSWHLLLCLHGLSCFPGLGRKPQARDATGWSGRLAEPRERSHGNSESRWAEGDGAEHTAPATASVHVSQPSKHAALQLTLTGV